MSSEKWRSFCLGFNVLKLGHTWPTLDENCENSPTQTNNFVLQIIHETQLSDISLLLNTT